MSGPTKIEWADFTWSPVTGCTKVSAGCAHYYAERQAKRFAGRAGYPAEHPFAVTLHPERLDEPLHWRKPRRIFVCSMSDLFHPDVDDGFIADVWTVLDACEQHRFLILTKRPERMASLTGIGDAGKLWRLPNVWLGTSVEDQSTADERIPNLLRCPAAVRFVSYEPALGPVDFGDNLVYLCGPTCTEAGLGINWVIAAGESGPNARPCYLEWIRSVVGQCRRAGVPVFVKQLGRFPSSNQPEGTFWEPLWADKACTKLSGRYAPYGGLAHKGGNPADWPEDLRVQEYPNAYG